jgi:transposase-like protein
LANPIVTPIIPVCPSCGSVEAYEARRANGALRFRCKGCKKDFTITSGTLFASHKLPLRGYLAASAVFCNEVKGKSALALSRDLGLSYKSAFVLLHKLREAMAEEMKGRVVGGEGKEAEVDGGYFGGYVKPANLKERRVDRRFARNQNGKRKVVVIIRERGGNSVPAVFNTESAAASFIRARIAKGTVVHADEAGSWDNLHERFEMKRINHQETYSLDGACTNQAEEHFSRLRPPRSAFTITLLARVCSAMRGSHHGGRTIAASRNGDQVRRVAALAMKRGKSVDFTGYWQRHVVS